jgi:proteasome inhibitor subunit 1 (PI31)
VLDINTNDFVSPSFFPHHIDESNQPLVHGFISSSRIADLTSQIKLKIVQHLVPGLRKDGYTEQVTTTGAGPSNPPAPVPARPNPQQPQDFYRPPPLFPPRIPLEIGRSDLDPFPVNPFLPPNVFPQGGDGMFVGPDHPIFSDRMRAPFGDHGPWGGDGFLPPMGAPPGARFDPVGPGPLSGRVPGRGRGGAGRFSGEPDNDELMPPGAVRP